MSVAFTWTKTGILPWLIGSSHSNRVGGCCFCFFFFFFFFFNWRITALQHCVSFWRMNHLCGYMLLPLGPPAPPSLDATTLGHHRALSWAPWATQQLPTSSLFTHSGVHVSATLPVRAPLPLPICSLRLRLYLWGAAVLIFKKIKMWNGWFVFIKSHAHRRTSLACTLDPLDPWPSSWLSSPLMPAPPAYLPGPRLHHWEAWPHQRGVAQPWNVGVWKRTVEYCCSEHHVSSGSRLVQTARTKGWRWNQLGGWDWHIYTIDTGDQASKA